MAGFSGRIDFDILEGDGPSSRPRSPLDQPPGPAPVTAEPEPSAAKPEAVVFDKADEAESIQALRDEREGIHKQLAELRERIKQAGVEDRRPLESESTQLTARSEELEAMISERSSKTEDR